MTFWKFIDAFPYESLVRPVLFRLNPERAQVLAESVLAATPLWRLLGPILNVHDDRLRTVIGGLQLSNPIGLAAGFDKQCKYVESLSHLGFGYLVAGTVVPRLSLGNPRPRLLRNVKERSLINSMGFPSEGLERIAERLRRGPKVSTPTIVSISSLEESGFLECHRVLEPLVDAIELNVSSPNTLGLRHFHGRKELRSLLSAINSERKKPLFLKLPPFQDEQSREQVLGMLREGLAAGITGITAINTVPVTDPRLAVGRGGLSGKMIFPEMIRVIRELREESGSGLVINAAGGISTGDDVLAALQAGANTVQLYTALIYQGPTVINKILTELVNRLNEQ